MKCSHDGSVLGRAPEDKGDVRCGGDSLHPARVATEHLRRLVGVQVVHTDLTVGRPAHHCRIVRVRQKLKHTCFGVDLVVVISYDVLCCECVYVAYVGLACSTFHRQILPFFCALCHLVVQ